MDNLKEFLLPKRFSGYGYIVAILTAFAGGIFGVITSIRTTERRQFHCNSHGILADKNFLTAKCFNQYEQHYNAPLPLYGFVLLTFATLVLICIIYSWCFVKSRVDRVEEVCAPNPESPRPTPVIRTRYIFWSYLIQLLVRFCFGAFFVSLQLTGLYPSNFPTQFHCQWNPKRTTNTANFNVTHFNSSLPINCENSIAREKTVWAMVVWILHIIFACLVLLEAFYLLARACHAKTFMRDSEFCKRHLFKRSSVPLMQEDFIRRLRDRINEDTEYLEPLIPLNPEEDDKRKAIDDIYIDLIINSGRVTHNFHRSKNRQELLDVYMKPPESSVRINNVDELFLFNGESYHIILVVGRPGIGKTSLCTNIIRDWCKRKALEQFKYVFTFRFRHLNTETVTKMSLGQFLSKAEHSSGTIDSSLLQNIAENPESVLIIFDGFDEYKHRENLMKDQLEFSGSNGLTDEIPVTALYVKLLQKKLLSGATILTTSRPNAVDTLKMFRFDRVAEILGFTVEKIQSYVEKFCKDDTDTASSMWQHIERNVNLLYLCYIPVTCRIICSLLEDCIKTQNAGSQNFALPTTLTDVYKGALRLFLFKHNPEYQRQTLTDHYRKNAFLDSIENALSKLGLLARKGIDERRLIFEKEEVEGLENCGLLNCMPSKEKPRFGFVQPPQYCFIHYTLQEFLAARYIAKIPDPDKVAQFIESKVHDANWHLVIQFITGLLQDRQFVAQVAEYLISIFCDCVIATKNTQILLLMLKCFYEMNNEDVTIRAATTLSSNDKFNNHIDLSDIDVAPVDCTAIVYVLRYCGPRLLLLDIYENYSFGDHGCSELTKIFTRKEYNQINDQGALNLCDETCHLTQLNLRLGYNEITDKGVLNLSDALKCENCHLTQLDLRYNQITDQGVLHLSDALKCENCHLTQLGLSINGITDQGVLHLSDALKCENCQLTQLDLSDNKITDEGLSHLSDALKCENCQLTQLDLSDNKITDEGLSHLSDALKCENCQLTQLDLMSNQITDEGVLHLSDALKCENCQLTQLDLMSNQITDQGVLHLSVALKCENCHLTQLDLSNNKITDQGVLHLSDALKSENCHLTQLDLSFNAMTDQCVLHLSDALKCENCHLTYLDLGINGITDEGELHLRDALKCGNCQLNLHTLTA